MTDDRLAPHGRDDQGRIYPSASARDRDRYGRLAYHVFHELMMIRLQATSIPPSWRLLNGRESAAWRRVGDILREAACEEFGGGASLAGRLVIARLDHPTPPWLPGSPTQPKRSEDV